MLLSLNIEILMIGITKNARRFLSYILSNIKYKTFFIVLLINTSYGYVNMELYALCRHISKLDYCCIHQTPTLALYSLSFFI